MNAARTIVRGRSPAQPARVSAGRHGAEREAELAGEAAARRMPFAGWSFAAVAPGPSEAADDPRVAAAVAGPGRALEPGARGRLEAQLGGDLSTVRLHEDADAVAATRALGAEGFARGEDVALAEPFDPSSPRSRRLVAHELAHVVQQRAAGAAAVQLSNGGAVTPVTRLDALPEADRKRIQVSTVQVTVPGINDKFSTKGATVTSAFPSGVTAEFDASVDAALRHGLRNVAGSLSAGVELTPAPLPPNSTMTLELDVPGKGKALYRFTYHAPPAPAGGKAKAPARRILVEALGKASGAPTAPDKVAAKIKSHSLGHSYTGAALDALRAALDQIPDAQLSVVDGLKFARARVHPTEPDRGGDYDQKTHTVTMFDRAFASTTTRFRSAGTTTSDEATRAIVHEIGHAIDLASLRKAWRGKEAADKAVTALSAKYPDPTNPTGYRFPTGGPEEKDVKAVEKAARDAEAAVLAARSRSGTRTEKDKTSGDFRDVIGTKADSDFRKAAAKDGGKAVTAYGDKDFQEMFAESYSLYITSPATLKALRPNVFAHLDKTLPK